MRIALALAGLLLAASSAWCVRGPQYLSGRALGMGDAFDKKATTALPAGSFAVMPKGEHHFAWAKGATVVQVHGVGPWGINYVNSADDPRTATPK